MINFNAFMLLFMIIAGGAVSPFLLEYLSY